MGYDIHITRQENWYDEDNTKRISLDEWKSFLMNDPEMRLDNFAEAVTTSDDQIRVESDGLAVWAKYSGNDLNGNFACFDYSNGNIVCQNPDDEIIKKMIDIAQRLNAKVQGDEGELYEATVGEEVTDKQLNQEKPWWKFW